MIREAGGATALIEAVESGRSSFREPARRAVSVPIEDRMEQLAEAGVEVATLGGDNYPSELAGIPDPPMALFLRGRLSPRPRVAVIGSRQATSASLRMAREAGAALAGRGVTVVSGLALGVDAEAHRGMVSERGRGVAVVATGPDLWYPPAHRRLGEDLLALDGAVVSEYPPGTEAARWRFPLRNRIITGLSDAVLVVEAAEKSGTMIAARYARGQGKTLMAAPSEITRTDNRGCDHLIRRGAIIVSGTESLMEGVDAATSEVGPSRLPFGQE